MHAPLPDTVGRAPHRAAGLIARHQADVWRYLRHLGCGRAEADDLTQETFVVLLRTADFEDRSRTATAAWLRRVAENQFRNHQRSRQRRLDPAWIEAVNAVWSADEQPADRRLDALRVCVEGLDGPARTLVDAAYREGAGRAELAARFGMRENGIKTRLQRLRAALRRCVERRLERSEDS